jgi:hypothetical protein
MQICGGVVTSLAPVHLIKQRAIIHRREQTPTGGFPAGSLRRVENAMPEPAKPIPQDLADSFCAAVVRFPDGGFGSPEPTVEFRGHVEPISTICTMVEPFKDDQLPEDIFARLCRYMRLGDEKLKTNLAGDQSYSMAGDCLLQLIQRRVDEYIVWL